MEEKGMQLDANVIIDVQNVRLEKIDEKRVISQLTQGTLKINFAEKQEIYFISINDFVYSLYQEMPIYVTPYQTSISYIFPIIEGIENQSQFDIINSILSNITTLIFNQPQSSQQQSQQKVVAPVPIQISDQDQLSEPELEQKEIPQKNQVEERKKEDYVETPTPQQPEDVKEENKQELKSNQKEPKNKNSVANFIIGGGTFLATGLLKGAKILESGIKKTGNYIDSKITVQKEVKLSENTKKNVELMKNATGTVITYTGQAAKQIIELNINLAQMVASAILPDNQDDKDQQKQLNPQLEYLKEIGYASLVAGDQVLKKLDEASTIVGKQLGESSHKIVLTKYGTEVADVFDKGTDVVGNAAKAYKDVQKVGVKSLVKEAAKETAKQVGDQL